MKYWPVPKSYSKKLPVNGRGSFGERRLDRIHCGIDIYAPQGSEVVAIEDGVVLDAGTFTSPEEKIYWNVTHYILIENVNGKYYKYCELEEVNIKIGDKIKAGDVIGKIAFVLNIEKVNDESPGYIRDLKEFGYASMLHLELYLCESIPKKFYAGGNWYGTELPECFLNPYDYLY